MSGAQAENVLPLSAYLPFWQKISASEQSKLLAAARQRTFHNGDVLSSGRNECTGLFVVCSGQLRAFILSETGKELTLYRLLPRDICLMSASCMLHSLQFDIQIEALEETVVYQIPTDAYKSIMEQSAAVANYTNELMASRFSEVVWLMDQVLNHRLDSRLAALLLEEKDLAGSDMLVCTHEQLGNHLGSAREVVTRMLRYFQEEKLVRLTRGKIEITNEKGLEALAGESLR